MMRSGFATPDLSRCRLLAGTVGLVYKWWSLFARLANPGRYREAITARPLLLSAIPRRTHHAGQVTLIERPPGATWSLEACSLTRC
jgi:hypothetical protein